MWYINTKTRLFSSIAVPDEAFTNKAKKYFEIKDSQLKIVYDLVGTSYILKSMSPSSKILYAYAGSDEHAKFAIFERNPSTFQTSIGSIDAMSLNCLLSKDIERTADVILALANAGKLGQTAYSAITTDCIISKTSLIAFTLAIKKALNQEHACCLYSNLLDLYIPIYDYKNWVSACTGPEVIKQDLKAIIFQKGVDTSQFDTISLDEYAKRLAQIANMQNQQSNNMFKMVNNNQIKPEDWLIFADKENCKPGKVIGTEQLNLYPCEFNPQVLSNIVSVFDKAGFTEAQIEQGDQAVLTSLGLSPQNSKVHKLTSSNSKTQQAILQFYVVETQNHLACFRVCISQSANQQ